tara:strand:+ start:423 stop:815 length:393 start_codon:yes stop_codon:yes gene_type:complete
MADDITAFMVRRDDDGKVDPYEVEVLGIRNEPLTISILPTTLRSLKGLKDPDGDAVSWPVEDKIRYVREHVVVPDFSGVTEDDMLDGMTMWDLDMLLITAIQHGGPMRQKKNQEAKKKGPTKGSGRSRRK